MKILIIRLSSIGDIVLVSPVLRCLSEQLPEAELHMMVKPPFREIADANPHIARTLLYGEPVEEKYDYVVDLQCNARSRKVCRGIKAPRLTFRKQNFAKALLTLTKHELIPIRHICERYLEAVAPLGVKNDGKGLEFPLPPLTTHHSPLTTDHYTVLVVGANHFTKTIPLETLLSLARQTPSPVLLLGGKKEAALTAALPWPDNVTDLCGKTTLMESAALLRDAAHVITPDTGMMHIAVALGAPLTLVWGCTDPRYGFAPYLPSAPVRQLVPSCRCHPCSKLGHKKCPLGHFRCMRDHDLSTLNSQLSTQL